MDRLASALAASNAPLALELALAEWHSSRSPQLAELVELVGARCGAPPAAEADVQRWWLEHARPYDATHVSPLVAHVTVKLRASDATWTSVRERWAGSAIERALAAEPAMPQHRNWIERVLAMLAWPDDPRAAPVLAGWLASHELFVRSPAFDVVYGAIAERLDALADVRVVPVLAAFLADAEPGFRNQRALVERVHAALVARAPATSVAELEALAAPLRARGQELDRLWQAVAESPADRGTRAVLGDALLAAGDARGELIALQLAIEAERADPDRDPRARRVKRLLELWWDGWLGPSLAALLVRDGTEFRGGMLEVIRVGYPGTPRRAWTGAHGHRELATVHTARPGRAPALEYARLVAALPNLRTLQADTPAALLELARLGAPLAITALEYPQAERQDGPIGPVLETFGAFARVAPALARIVLAPAPLGEELDGLVAALPGLFSRLDTIELVAPSRLAARELTARFAGDARVAVV